MHMRALIGTSDGLKFGVNVDYTASDPGSRVERPQPEDITILAIYPNTPITDEIRRLVYDAVDEQLRDEWDERVDHKLDARDEYRKECA